MLFAILGYISFLITHLVSLNKTRGSSATKNNFWKSHLRAFIAILKIPKSSWEPPTQYLPKPLETILWLVLFIRSLPESKCQWHKATTHSACCLHDDAVHYKFSRGAWTAPWEDIMWLWKMTRERREATGAPRLSARCAKAHPACYYLHGPFRTDAKKMELISFFFFTPFQRRKKKH